MQKLILTDCDGVLLDWVWMFDQWMIKHKFYKIKDEAYSIAECYGLREEDSQRLISMFNESVYAANIPSYIDSIKYIKKLHEEMGVVLHVISAISSDQLIVRSRVENLYTVFGKSVFYKISCVDSSEEKYPLLESYKDSGLFWLEDHTGNYEMGKSLGLNSLLMDQPYNREAVTSDRVYSWHDIYRKVHDNSI